MSQNFNLLKAKRQYVKLFHDFRAFANGVSFTNPADKYNFLSSLLPNRYTEDQFNDKGKCVAKKGDPKPCFFNPEKGYSDGELLEAIDLFFFIFKDYVDDQTDDHIKNLVATATQTSGNDEDYMSFRQESLLGDQICITLARSFGLPEPQVEGRQPVYEDWINSMCLLFGNKDGFYRNILNMAKSIRNSLAHKADVPIERINWLPTLQFLLHSYVGLCLLLIRHLGNPLKDGVVNDIFTKFRQKMVLVSTNIPVQVKILAHTESGLVEIYSEKEPLYDRSVEMLPYVKYDVVIEGRDSIHQVELDATSNKVKININCDVDVCNVINNARVGDYVKDNQELFSSNVPYWRDLAKSLNRLYSSGTLLYATISQIDGDKLLQLMKSQDVECKAELEIYARMYGESLHQLSESLEKLLDSDTAYAEYLSRLISIDSKVNQLFFDSEVLDIRDIAAIVNLLSFAGDELTHRASLKRIIDAIAFVKYGSSCSHQNVSAFFFMGAIICASLKGLAIDNIGATILHDLYKVLPGNFERFVTRDYATAIMSAESDWNLYRYELKINK